MFAVSCRDTVKDLVSVLAPHINAVSALPLLNEIDASALPLPPEQLFVAPGTADVRLKSVPRVISFRLVGGEVEGVELSVTLSPKNFTSYFVTPVLFPVTAMFRACCAMNITLLNVLLNRRFLISPAVPLIAADDNIKTMVITIISSTIVKPL